LNEKLLVFVVLDCHVVSLCLSLNFPSDFYSQWLLTYSQLSILWQFEGSVDFCTGRHCIIS